MSSWDGLGVETEAHRMSALARLRDILANTLGGKPPGEETTPKKMPALMNLGAVLMTSGVFRRPPVTPRPIMPRPSGDPVRLTLPRSLEYGAHARLRDMLTNTLG